VKPEDPQKVTQVVALRIGEQRAEAGLTQAQVAERLGTTVTNYQRVEHGLQNVTINTLVRIANAIGVKTSSFFDTRELTPRKRRRGRPPKSVT